MYGNNTPPRAIVGSAKEVKLGNRLKKIGEAWQESLWDIYENLGAVHYGMNFKRSAAQRVSYFVAEMGEADVDEPVATANQAANDALDRLGDVGEIVGEFVIQENVAGEGFLVGREREDGETWQVVSTGELNDRRKPGAPEETRITDDDFVLQIWRPNPRDHSRPDSPLRSVQAQCEQLLLLNDQIGATAMSRLSAGIFFVADEFSFPGDPDEEPDGDPFQKELIEMMTTAVKDAQSASRITPGVVRGPADLIEKGVKYFEFGREMDKTFAAMREELLRQIANGIDLPAEILTGLADLNHWSLWGIDESTAKHHVDPDVLQILSGLTTGYLRPTLIEAGVPNPERYMVWRDYSDLTSRPLSVDQAERFFDKGVITADQLKRIANVSADPDNAIGPGDIATRSEAVGVLFRAGFEPEAILAALGLPSIRHSGVAPVTVQSEKEVDNTPDSPAGPDNVEPGPPMTATQGISLDRFAEIDQVLAASVIEASEAAFHRALERAGAKIRAKAKKDRQITAQIDGIPNFDVTRHLGALQVEKLQVTPDQLVPADTFDALVKRLVAQITRAQNEVTEQIEEIVGPVAVPPAELEEDRDSAIAAFIAALLSLVTARLFTAAPDPDPAETGEFNDTIATGQLVFQLLTQAGGGGLVEEFTPTTPRGLALGQRTRSILRDHGYVTESQTWNYGLAPRATNFEPHLRLNGKSFVSLESSELAATEGWLGVSHYFPGDHKGCLCSLVPTVLPAAE